jgi:hypothetical protein
MFWDFISLRPESTHQVMFLFSDRGIPDGHRHMNGYGSHTFKLVNDKNEAVYAKFHYKVRRARKSVHLIMFYFCLYSEILKCHLIKIFTIFLTFLVRGFLVVSLKFYLTSFQVQVTTECLFFTDWWFSEHSRDYDTIRKHNFFIFLLLFSAIYLSLSSALSSSFSLI